MTMTAMLMSMKQLFIALFTFTFIFTISSSIPQLGKLIELPTIASIQPAT